MSVGPLALELIIVFCLAVFLLHRYGNITKQRPVVTFFTLTAWYFSLIIIFILPLDVSSTFYSQCMSNERSDNLVADKENSTSAFRNVTEEPELQSTAAKTECKMPWSYVPDYTLPTMWRIVYWSSQCLTWVILPFLQSYCWSGHFSVLGKMKHALIKNAVYYGTYLVIFVILLIYVAAASDISLEFSQLKVVCVTASNTWGMFLLILLLGYGLVEVPRTLWRSANPVWTMAYTHFKLAKLSTEKQEAAENIEDLLEELKRSCENVKYNHPLWHDLAIIVKKCPEEFQEKISQGMDDYVEYEDQRQTSRKVTEKEVIQLHEKLIKALQTKQRTTVQWGILVNKAVQVENVVKNLRSTAGRKAWTESSEENIRSSFACHPTLKWYWECAIKPLLKRIGAVSLMVLSFMVIWSECTFFNEKPVLSLFAIFINLAQERYNYFYIEMASCAIISYLCVCVYYTVFRVKFFNIYYIAGHHQTNEPSLMFVAIMLCRLTPPMCLNFLGLIHLDTHITKGTMIETSYTHIMGHLDVIPFISKGFNIYFPILVVVLCIATYFSFGHRCLSWIGFQQFINADADDFTGDLVEEGKQLLKRELRQRERETDRRATGTASLSKSGILSRKWQGRTMQDAEKNFESHEESDKVELLSDTDGSALRYDSTKDGLGSSKLHSSRWSTRPVAAKRPPKNIFDDV